MALNEYREKRLFGSTPEPRPKKTRPEKTLRFVVQKHSASHLHYDFRLESKGVLVSWAIPKGPSLNPSDKRLAMKTEDHPYEYQNFEGVIPKGNYGAGKVIVWDAGKYEINKSKSKKIQEENISNAIKKGKLHITLHGKKLKGEFILIKKSPEEHNQWFFIKVNDKYATTEAITEQDQSILTKRTLDDLDQDNSADWRAAKNAIKKYGVKKPLPTPIKPMLATLINQAFNDKNWIFEIKWDGYRAIAEINKNDVKLYSRNGNSFKQTYPVLVKELSAIKKSVVLDGEIVALDENGVPNFNSLQNYSPNSSNVFLAYYIFDIIGIDGYDLTKTPLYVRKQILKRLLPASNVIRYSDHITEKGEKMYKAVTSQQLEGIVAKEKTSYYSIGKKTKTWLKIKIKNQQEAVIGGYTEPKGNRKGIGALLLGVFENGSLRYVGRAGTGLKDTEFITIRRHLEEIEISHSPFKIKPKVTDTVHWVNPDIVCEVNFSEWTSQGHMRHPSIKGIRTDKSPKTVHSEKPIQAKEVLKSNKRFTITHENKVFWPELNITKKDLVDYYERISKYILPYIQNRPMTLLRQPHGIYGQSFFQKDIAELNLLAGLIYKHHSSSGNKTIHYFVCTDEESLLYMVQLGCIEINPWNSTIKHIKKPDWLVLDLDPENISFTRVIEVALHAKELLDSIHIPAFIKTSGKTGLHIYIPLHAKYSYDQTRQFSELLAKTMQSQLPNTTSVVRSPPKRQKKVYLDYLQNRFGQTLAAPYSVRPTIDASVSMPLFWHEVTPRLQPKDFNLKNVPALIINRKDPWKDFWKTTASIEVGLDNLSKLYLH